MADLESHPVCQCNNVDTIVQCEGVFTYILDKIVFREPIQSHNTPFIDCVPPLLHYWRLCFMIKSWKIFLIKSWQSDNEGCFIFIVHHPSSSREEGEVGQTADTDTNLGILTIYHLTISLVMMAAVSALCTPINQNVSFFESPTKCPTPNCPKVYWGPSSILCPFIMFLYLPHYYVRRITPLTHSSLHLDCVWLL